MASQQSFLIVIQLLLRAASIALSVAAIGVGLSVSAQSSIPWIMVFVAASVALLTSSIEFRPHLLQSCRFPRSSRLPPWVFIITGITAIGLVVYVVWGLVNYQGSGGKWENEKVAEVWVLVALGRSFGVVPGQNVNSGNVPADVPPKIKKTPPVAEQSNVPARLDNQLSFSFVPTSPTVSTKITARPFRLIWKRICQNSHLKRLKHTATKTNHPQQKLSTDTDTDTYGEEGFGKEGIAESEEGELGCGELLQLLRQNSFYTFDGHQTTRSSPLPPTYDRQFTPEATRVPTQDEVKCFRATFLKTKNNEIFVRNAAADYHNRTDIDPSSLLEDSHEKGPFGEYVDWEIHNDHTRHSPLHTPYPTQFEAVDLGSRLEQDHHLLVLSAGCSALEMGGAGGAAIEYDLFRCSRED
ncbi:uncharacterized protein PAC_14528 [Phialocephala subalpina]|uniref:Uncharacterized protein n=1 Tax=Phialocephala subalpina TaxID=576137 RepID=A0A1L7XHW1_9HELO|nr:uncharacterized protein PAC_14528 [Phialocephala subalpina]